MKPAIPTVMSVAKYSTLAPLEKEKYVERKIAEILKLNSHGITIAEILEHTPFSRPTIIKHLEKMVSKRQGYKILRGNTFIYYPNSKSVYAEKPVVWEIEKKRSYTATFIQNDFGDFIFLEEKGGDGISGGSWLISKEDWETFKAFIKKVDKETYENGR